MKSSVKAKTRRRVPRDLFAELSEGMEALAEARHGKRTLRTHALEYKPAPTVTPQELIRGRKNLKISRALFAVYLRNNVRTLENCADQSGQALSGHGPTARNHLVAAESVDRSPD